MLTVIKHKNRVLAKIHVDITMLMQNSIWYSIFANAMSKVEPLKQARFSQNAHR